MKWLLLIAIPFLWAACTKDDVVGQATSTPTELTFEQRTAGNNPYNVENMKLAYQYLVEQGRLNRALFPDFKITATHNYMKLKPSTLEEEDQINADTTFIALDYPLDLDLGERYFESRPALEEGQIPEYYSSLKVNQSIKYSGQKEVIEQMYVPEEDPYFENADEDYKPGTEQITTRAQLHDELLFTAYFLKGLEYLLAPDLNAAKDTGIEDDKPQKPVLTHTNNELILDGESAERFNDAIIKPLGIGKKWYPSGNLRYVDTSFPAGQQNRPLEGAQVLLRQGVTMRQAITDANGNFSTSKLRGHARFVIQWERAKYNIKNFKGWQAEQQGPHQRSPWNWTIQPDHNSQYDIYLALIHVACLDYYYGNRFQLTQPRNNNRIKATNSTPFEDKNSSHATIRRLIGSSDIKLCAWQANHSSIYGTTIHELAHSAHYEFNRPGYNQLVADGHIEPWLPWGESYSNPVGPTARSARRTLETWATTVELMFVQRRYSLIGNGHDNTTRVADRYRYIMQNYTLLNEPFYTSCGFDLTDSFNQNAWSSTLPIDNVSGYTIKQLETSLYGATNWNKWRDNIKSQHNNATSVNVDVLFANCN